VVSVLQILNSSMKKFLCKILKTSCPIEIKKEEVSKEESPFLTIQMLKEAFPQASNEILNKYHLAIVETCNRYNIKSAKRVASFLSQCAHESNNFSVVRENLSYSSDALMRVWPKHFPTKEIALKYHRQPERIANRAYANRIGNGTEASGDGWKYRGRGFIQVTGKHNYTECDKELKLDLVNKPEQLEDAPAAVLSAGWFWNKNNLNALADKEDVLGLTRRINGGTHGLDDRQKKYTVAITALKKYLD